LPAVRCIQYSVYVSCSATTFAVNVLLQKSISDLYQSRYNPIPLIGLRGIRANQLNNASLSMSTQTQSYKLSYQLWHDLVNYQCQHGHDLINYQCQQEHDHINFQCEHRLNLIYYHCQHGHNLFNSFTKQIIINSLTVIKVVSIPTECILGSWLQIKFNRRNNKFCVVKYVVKLITIWIWHNYL